MRDIIFIVFTLSVGLVTVHSFPGGAPLARCDDMQPSVALHGAEAQTGASPYTLSFGSNVMNYGTDDITITISDDVPLKGLLCQMRDKDDNQVGSFPEPVASLKTLDCNGVGSHSGITHSNNDDKTDVTFTWSPPDSDMGELTLRCTLVKVKSTYWVGLEADQKLMYDSGSDENESDESDSAPAFHSGFLALMMIGAAYIMRRAFAN